MCGGLSTTDITCVWLHVVGIAEGESGMRVGQSSSMGPAANGAMRTIIIWWNIMSVTVNVFCTPSSSLNDLLAKPIQCENKMCTGYDLRFTCR
jgi:hypothetical protein